MSIILNFKQVSPTTLEFIIGNADTLNNLIYELDSDFQDQSPELNAVLNENDRVKGIDLDKTWAGILFLLSNQPEIEDIPLAAIVFGLNTLSANEDEDEDARYLTPEEVKTLTPALTEISEDKLFASYDAGAMKELEDQTQTTDESGSVNDQKYLWKYFCSLRDHYHDAAGRGNGMIIFKS